MYMYVYTYTYERQDIIQIALKREGERSAVKKERFGKRHFRPTATPIFYQNDLEIPQM
jgi:hypothetical protein